MSADRTGVLSRLLIIRPTNAAVGTRAESGCCAAAERRAVSARSDQLENRTRRTIGSLACSESACSGLCIQSAIAVFATSHVARSARTG